MKGKFRIFFSPCFQGHEKISFTKCSVSYENSEKSKRKGLCVFIVNRVFGMQTILLWLIITSRYDFLTGFFSLHALFLGYNVLPGGGAHL